MASKFGEIGSFETVGVGFRGLGVGEELRAGRVDLKYVREAAWRGPGEETCEGLRFHFCG